MTETAGLLLSLHGHLRSVGVDVPLVQALGWRAAVCTSCREGAWGGGLVGLYGAAVFLLRSLRHGPRGRASSVENRDLVTGFGG